MFACIAPDVKCRLESAVQHAPVHDRNQQWVSRDSGVEKVVQGLKRTWPAVQKGRSAMEGVAEGMD